MNRFCVHTMTTKPWSLADCARHFPAAGAGGITVWRQHLEGRDIKQDGDMLRSAGLEIISLCRGGFFPAKTSLGLRAAIDDNPIDVPVAKRGLRLSGTLLGEW